MTERKFTDEEVIKSLEHCKVSDCLGCPCHTCIESCLDVLTPNALDLINRKNAEIDILVRKHDTLLDELAEKQAEIENLKNTIKEMTEE